jgi:hypothetical protein
MIQVHANRYKSLCKIAGISWPVGSRKLEFLLHQGGVPTSIIGTDSEFSVYTWEGVLVCEVVPPTQFPHYECLLTHNEYLEFSSSPYSSSVAILREEGYYEAHTSPH